MEKYYMVPTLYIMYCLWISEQTAALAIYSVDRLIFYSWS